MLKALNPKFLSIMCDTLPGAPAQSARTAARHRTPPTRELRSDELRDKSELSSRPRVHRSAHRKMITTTWSSGTALLASVESQVSESADKA